MLAKATIWNESGAIIATGHASAKAKSNSIWVGREVEKAETAAIGRALGHAGYGTQFDNDDEGDYLADSPLERRSSASNASNSSATPQRTMTTAKAPENALQANVEDKCPLLKDMWGNFWKMVIPLYGNKSHAENSVKKMMNAGALSAEMTLQDAVAVVQAHIAEKNAPPAPEVGDF